MNKALFASIIILLLSVLSAIKVAEANSITGNPIPPPGTIPPKITISSPQNNQTYSSNVIYLTLNVTKPMLDNWSSGLRLIVYTLDGKSSRIYAGDPTSGFYYKPGLPEYSTSFPLPPLQAGNHTLGIYVKGEVWTTPITATTDIMYSQTESLATIHFTTLTQQPTSTPLPNLTPSPTRITPGAEWGSGQIRCAIELPHNATYTAQNIRLILWTGRQEFFSSGSYSIDGGPETYINVGVYEGATFNTTVHLTDGNHTVRLKVYGGGDLSDFNGFATVQFTVNHTLPFITLESPQNQTYHNQTIDLNYVLVDKENSEAKYSLDNKENITVSNLLSSPRLDNLTDGTHHVVVYAEDDFGNVYSAKTLFEVKNNPLPATVAGIPIIIVLVAIIAPIIVALVLLVFTKRRKSKYLSKKTSF